MSASCNAAPPRLDAEHALFVQGGVSIVVGSRDPDRAPLLNRALGCRVSADRRRLTVFLWRPQAGPLLRALRHTGLLAAVFSEPPTHRTIQLKASDARQQRLRKDDVALVDEYRRRFAQALMALGFQAPFAYGLTECRPDELTAVTFTPTQIFAQTPGPGAGEPLVLAS